MSAVEQKWFIRLLLKDMKFKLGYKVILDIFHADANEIYSLTTSLKQVSLVVLLKFIHDIL